ncbi:MAG: ComEC/Rec2 family competence protein, partial [Verrucomicrobiae bacterium]|nr:ComEC/Rec2 family competence protein [Verrucomicrobiae bacterium]
MERSRIWAELTGAAGRDPLLWVALAAGIGIVAEDYLPVSVPLVVPVVMAVVGLGLAVRRPGWRGMFLVGAAGVFAFAHGVALWSVGQFPFSPNLRQGDSIRVMAEGIVVDEPAAPGTGGGSRSGRCTIRFSQMTVAGHTWKCDQRLPVRLMNPNASLHYGDRIRTTGLLRPFPPPVSPGAFDPKAFFFRTLGATGEFVVGPGDRIDRLASGEGHRLIDWALRSRHAIELAITKGLMDQPDEAAVIKAMVLGSREDTPEHIEEAYRLSGAMHVFAVSGLHVGIFGGILWAILRLLRVPRRFAVLVLIPAVLFYATVTGLRPSAVRAAIMFAIVMSGFLFARRPRLLNSLGLAALVILAYDTQQLFLPGFQLSFAVLTSIALF